MKGLRLPRKPNSEALCALNERPLTALKDLADLLPDLGVLEAATSVGDFWQIIGPVGAGAGGDDLIGIGVDDEVGVMGDDDDLT